MDVTQAVVVFNALANRRRINVLRIVAGTPDGMVLDDLASHLGVRKNLIWVHLKVLAAAGLISFDRTPEKVICRAEMDRVREAFRTVTDLR